jgi:hypothetical protein
MVSYSDEQIKDLIKILAGKRINILAPLLEPEKALRNCSTNCQTRFLKVRLMAEDIT